MKGNGEKLFKHLCLFLFFIMGSAGVLTAVYDIFGGSIAFFVVPAVLVSSYLIYLSSHDNLHFLIQLLFVFAVMYLLIYVKNDKTQDYAENIIYCITKLKSFRTYEVSLFFIFAGIIWAELASFLAVTLKKSWLYFILITVFVLVCASFGDGIRLYSIVLLLLSYVGMHILSLSENIQKNVYLLIFSAAIVAISLFVSYYTAGKLHNKIYDKADDCEGVVHRIVNDLIYSRGTDYDSGRVNAGNNYQRGTDSVEIWLSDKPTEPVYLKGFEGGDYTGNAWAEADEGDFFNQLAFEMGWNRWSNYMSSVYKEIYYNANNSSNPQILRKSRTITINPLLPNVKNRYYPYMGRWEHITRKENICYVYSYYELKDMNIRKDMLDMQSLRRFNYIQDSYEPYVYEHYLTLPSGMERLKALCEGKNFESVDEITEFIRSVLSQRTYSLRPGMAPLNEDIVDYFMFENRRGYCVHFASAAVLMYRMLGVPARYVTGYKANAGLFRELDNGDYYFKATDRDAHAWAEIYQKDKGWIPVDLTPGAANSADQGNENPGEYESSAEQSDATTSDQTEDVTADYAAGHISYWLYAILIAVIITAAMLIRRVLRLRMINNYGVRKIFALLLDAMAVHGEKYTGLEKDFDEKLQNCVKVLDREKCRELVNTVYAEAYGNSKASGEKRALVLNIYRTSVKYIYSDVNIFRKICMKYVYCLC